MGERERVTDITVCGNKKSGKIVFAKFFPSLLATGEPPCTKQKIPEIEISVAKFSTPYDAWSSKKNKKMTSAESVKISIKIIKIEDFVRFLKIWAKYGFHNDVPHDFFL